MKAWLSAFRLRTLPLALSSILLGAFLAAKNLSYKFEVTLWCVITTVFLQILSNLANDYGDAQNGADNDNRKGPSRAVQTGAISKQAMFKAIVIFVILSLCSGLYLLWISFGLENLEQALVLLGIGLLAIIAAIKYTAGKNPYGYAGLGDISVFAFFGLVGVLGTYYLHALSFEWSLLMPAGACGFFSVVVLNINNIRDIDSDAIAGKRSIPVRLGKKAARVYNWLLIGFGLALAVVYTVVASDSPYQWLFLVSVPPLLFIGKSVYTIYEPMKIDPFLKFMALTTLLFALSFGVGGLLG